MGCCHGMDHRKSLPAHASFLFPARLGCLWQSSIFLIYLHFIMLSLWGKVLDKPARITAGDRTKCMTASECFGLLLIPRK